MSPQILELLIFAAIAFFIINKLISILGTSDDSEVKLKHGKFGEPKNLKDVTASGKDWTISAMINGVQKKKEKIDVSCLLDPKNSEILESLEEMSEKIDKFTVSDFIKKATKAWQMTVKAIQETDTPLIEQLVDKRFIEIILLKKPGYKDVDSKQLPELKITDVTFFGNSVMIKLLVTVKGIYPEEWTFSRNLNQTGPNWFLSNIEHIS